MRPGRFAGEVVQEAVEKLGKAPKDISEAEWRQILPEEVFHVTREAGTERPHTSSFVKSMVAGKYKCVCCSAELFV